MTYDDGAIRKRLALAGGVFLVIATAAPAIAQENQTHEFDIDKKELGEALTEFGIATGNQVLFKDADVRGKTANGVEGVYTSKEAVEALLENTGVDYRVDGNGTLLVGSEYVRRASLGEETTPTPFRVAQVETTSSREEVDERDNKEEALVVDTIIVTGTNIRGVENPTSPVLQFDRDDIDLSGAVTVEDFLRTVPQNFSSTTPIAQDSENDFVSISNPLAGTSVDLRGLGAGSTLTLLNGRRMSASGAGSFVDVSVLPLGAIERVDVLTDGASAIYGADAVGGVVNFITRKDYEGFEINGRYGTVTEGSKDEYSVGGAGGFQW